jgi:phage/plasmid-associated DNA primase
MIFKQNLLTQESLDYAAFKAVASIRRVLTTTEEFTEPKAVKDMMQQYKVDNSTILSWFLEVYNNNREQLSKLASREAYAAYTIWCGNSGRTKSSVTTFMQSVSADLGIEFKK